MTPNMQPDCFTRQPDAAVATATGLQARTGFVAGRKSAKPQRSAPWAAILVLLLALFAGCGGTPTATSTPATAPAAGDPSQAIVRVGDVTIRASAVQTSTLDAAVARGYSIPRDDSTILLLVMVRQGPEGDDTALPARITANVTDLRGQARPIAMRELRTDDPDSDSGRPLLDYIGTVDASLPDTLRFDVAIVRENGATATMQFNREFFPR